MKQKKKELILAKKRMTLKVFKKKIEKENKQLHE